ncbi:hypothetical protein GYH30_000795 [Glycine max]|nr:hypothetical protein GYH30_000795 [Glycine max]
MESKLLLKLDFGIGRWFSNMARGVAHFISYMRFTAMPLFYFEEAPEFGEYFIWWVQPTPPYYRHGVPVEIIKISSSSSSSNVPNYVLRSPYVGGDSEHIVSASLALAPVGEDLEMLKEDSPKVIEEPLDLIMEDGTVVVRGELP